MVWTLVAMAAVSVASSLLAPSDNGSDSAAQTPHPALPDSSLDATLPNVFGQAKLGGRFIYTTPTRRVSETVSGKGGQPKEERETFIADALAYAFTFGNEVILEELYINGKLVYDPNNVNDNIVAKSVQFENDHMTFFGGSQTQTPSTLLESFSGAGQVPSFLGMSYLVLRNLNLGDYGNSYPQLVAVVRSTTDYMNAKGFLEGAIELSGVNKDSQDAFGIDILTVDDSVAQFPFKGTAFQNTGTNIQGWIDPFIELYQLVLAETTPGSYALTVPYDIGAQTQNVTLVDAAELLGVDGGDKYTLNNTGKDAVPSSVSLTYQDPLRELDENSATVYNTKTFESNDISVTMRYILSRNQAYSGAERLLRAAWNRKKMLTFKLPLSADNFLRIGELVRFENETTIEGINWVVTEQTFSTDHFIEYTCYQINRMLYAYNKNILGSSFVRNVSATSDSLQESLLAIAIDAPLIESTDNQREGIYLAFETPGNSTAADVYISCDGGVTYENKGTLNNQTITGTITSPIPDGVPFVSDETTTLTVQLLDSGNALVSVTPAEYANNDQILVVNGEYISYRDVTPLGLGQFEISGITRGVEASEYAIQAHSSGSNFAILKGDSSNRPRITLDIADIGVKLVKVLVTGTTDLDTAVTQTIDYQGNSSKSLAPLEDAPVLEVNGDWTITYTDRSIVDGAPVNPDGDLFEIDLFNAGALIKTVTVNGNSYTYTVADQTTDTGGAVAVLTFDVYQIRTTLPIGRGHESLNP